MGLAVPDGSGAAIAAVPARLAGPRRRACEATSPRSEQSGASTARMRPSAVAGAVSHKDGQTLFELAFVQGKAAGQRGAAVLAHGGQQGVGVGRAKAASRPHRRRHRRPSSMSARAGSQHRTQDCTNARHTPV